MDEAGANGGAAMLLLLVGLLVWVATGRKKRSPLPTDRERTQLAGAVRNVAYRRFNKSGQISDVLGLGWVLLAYGKRSYDEAKS